MAEARSQDERRGDPLVRPPFEQRSRGAAPEFSVILKGCDPLRLEEARSRERGALAMQQDDAGDALDPTDGEAVEAVAGAELGVGPLGDAAALAIGGLPLGGADPPAPGRRRGVVGTGIVGRPAAALGPWRLDRGVGGDVAAGHRRDVVAGRQSAVDQVLAGMLPGPLDDLGLHRGDQPAVAALLADLHPDDRPAVAGARHLEVQGRSEAAVARLHHPHVGIGGRHPRLGDPSPPLLRQRLSLLLLDRFERRQRPICQRPGKGVHAGKDHTL